MRVTDTYHDRPRLGTQGKMRVSEEARQSVSVEAVSPAPVDHGGTDILMRSLASTSLIRFRQGPSRFLR